MKYKPVMLNNVCFPNLQHNINCVVLYSSLIELLHVPLDERHVGFLVAKLLLMVLDILASHCDLKRSRLNRWTVQKSKIQTECGQASPITSSSVISSPVTCPLSPTSLLKVKQSLPEPLPRSSTLQPSSFSGNGRPQPKNLEEQRGAFTIVMF